MFGGKMFGNKTLRGVRMLLAVVLACALLLPLFGAPAAVGAAPADGVYSFGANGNGQLGLGDSRMRTAPARIAALSNVRAVAAGDRHSLVLLHNGDVYSFGSNRIAANVFGMLGLGDQQDRQTPTKIQGLGKAKAIAAGRTHSLIILENGDLYSFGRNDGGMLGHGDYQNKLVPTKVQGISKAVAAAGGNAHTLVLLENGDVYSFGSNSSGQLGVPREDKTPHHIPRKISLPGKAKAIAAGDIHSLVLLENGDVYAFGHNRSGGLGYDAAGGVNYSFTPGKVQGIGAAKAVSAGSQSSLVLLENGDLYSFGNNQYGQLGLGDTTDRNRPTKVAALKGVSLITSGYHHSLAVLENGEVYSFGMGGGSYAGQLGHGDSNTRTTPTRIEGLRGNNGLAIAAGFSHSLVLIGTPPITITINNKPLHTDVPPVILDRRTMVPLRAIFEALGMGVSFDAATGTITGSKGDSRIQLVINSNQAMVNGKAVTLDVPATVLEGRTLVPVRFIAEGTGQSVGWEARTRTVIITTK